MQSDDLPKKLGKLSPPLSGLKPSLKAPSPKRDSFKPLSGLTALKKEAEPVKQETPMQVSPHPPSGPYPTGAYPVQMMTPEHFEAYSKHYPPVFFVQPPPGRHPQGHPGFSPHMQYIAIPTMPGAFPGVPMHPMALHQAYAQQKQQPSQPASKEEVGKPYACTYENCNKRFADASNAKRHELSHIGYKPYSCTMEGCQKRFTRRTSLRAHLTGVHKLSSDHPAFVKAILRRVRVPKLNSVITHAPEQPTFMASFPPTHPMMQQTMSPAPRSPSRLVAPQAKSRLRLSGLPAGMSAPSAPASDISSLRTISKDKTETV